MVEDRLPYRASIGGFPYAAIHAAKEELSMASRDAADGDNATRAKWTNESPLQTAVESRRQGLRRDKWSEEK